MAKVKFLDGVLSPSVQLSGGNGDQGTLTWNSDEETLDLVMNGSTLQVGQEIVYHAINQTGATIPNGTAVMATGSLGASGKITIAPMVADGSVESKYFIGVATEDIADGAAGRVTHFGKVRDIDTSSFAEGDVLWCDPLVAGRFTTTEPTAPNIKLAVGIVLNVHANNGTLFVRANQGTNLKDAGDVETTGATTGQLLQYNGTNWENWTPNFLTSYTETDPIFSASAAFGIASGDITNWNTAFGWGDHSVEGYLTSYTETDTLDSVTDRGNTTTNSITIGSALISATAPILDFVDTNSFSDVNDRFRIRAVGDAGRVQWYDDSAGTITDLMHFAPNGHVGIGTTSPDDKLDIENGRLRFTNSSSGRNSTIGMDDGFNLYVKNTPLGNLYLGNGTTTYVNGNFNVDNGVLFANASSNYVGIGNTSPNYRIHAQEARNTWGYRFENNTSDQDVHVFMAHGGGYGMAIDATTNAAGTYLFKVSGGDGVSARATNEYFRIDGDGKVGIGTNAPEQTLEVRGGVIGAGQGGGNLAPIGSNDAIIGTGVGFNGESGAFWSAADTQIFLGGVGANQREGISGMQGELITNSMMDGNLRLGGGVLTANHYTMEFTFLGTNVLYGNVTAGTIPIAAPIGVTDSGFCVNGSANAVFPDSGSGGFQYVNTNGSFAPNGFPEIMTSNDFQGFVTFGNVMSATSTPMGMDGARFGSQSMGGADIGMFEGMMTGGYQYASGSIKANAMMRTFSVFDYLGADSLNFDPMVANTLFAPSFTPTSDRKLKDNITPVSNGLDIVCGLQGVEYDLKSNGSHSSGFIAQDVEEVVPHAVIEKDEILRLNYNALAAYHNEAIKELKGMIDELKNEIQQLKNK